MGKASVSMLQFSTTAVGDYHLVFIYLFKINDRRTRKLLVLSEVHRNTPYGNVQKINKK